MKIVQIRTTVVGAPWRDLTFVELPTETGLAGHRSVLERPFLQARERLQARLDEAGG